MKLLLLIPGIAIAYVLLLYISSLFVDKNREYTKDSPYYRYLLGNATALMVILLRIRIHVTGLEKLPKGRFLLISNHRSNFDPILTWHVLRKQQLAFISKKENFDIPIFGRIIRKCCFMEIDRVDPAKAHVTVDKAAELIKADEVSVAVYPEGTRSKEGKLLRFHSGVLWIARKAEVPIVVMSIDGTEKIHKLTPFHRSEIHLDILEVIPTEKVLSTAPRELCDEASALMEENLSRYAETKVLRRAAKTVF